MSKDEKYFKICGGLLIPVALLGGGGKLFIFVIKDDTTIVLHIGRH